MFFLVEQAKCGGGGASLAKSGVQAPVNLQVKAKGLSKPHCTSIVRMTVDIHECYCAPFLTWTE